MGTLRGHFGGLLTASILWCSPAPAQTQLQFDRLNTLAHYGMVMAWCDKLGMKLAADWESQVDRDITAEALSWGLASDAAKQLVGETVARQSRINQIDLDVLAKNKTKTEAGLRDIRSVFVKYGRQCLEAARDPLLSHILTVPGDFNLEAAATEAADSFSQRWRLRELADTRNSGERRFDDGRWHVPLSYWRGTFRCHFPEIFARI